MLSPYAICALGPKHCYLGFRSYHEGIQTPLPAFDHVLPVLRLRLHVHVDGISRNICVIYFTYIALSKIMPVIVIVLTPVCHSYHHM
jgi:hypothetical protein